MKCNETAIGDSPLAAIGDSPLVATSDSVIEEYQEMIWKSRVDFINLKSLPGI
jgi:hypothetical protein